MNTAETITLIICVTLILIMPISALGTYLGVKKGADTVKKINDNFFNDEREDN